MCCKHFKPSMNGHTTRSVSIRAVYIFHVFFLFLNDDLFCIFFIFIFIFLDGETEGGDTPSMRECASPSVQKTPTHTVS